MAFATSFYNHGIFKSSIKRTWPLWAFYFIACFISLPLITLAGGIDNTEYFPSYLAGGLRELNVVNVIMSFVMGIAAAMATMGFMFSSRSTGLIASLPVKREAAFGSSYLAGFIPVVLINLIIAVITVLASLGAEVAFSDIFKGCGFWFLTNTAYFFVFYSIAVFIATLTGNSLALPVLYLIFNVLAVTLEALVRKLFSVLVFGIDSASAGSLEVLSPLIWFTNMNMSSGMTAPDALEGLSFFIHYPETLSVILYCVAAALLSVGALLLYRKRRMESAGDVISVNALKPVFKYGFSLCAALSIGLLIYFLLESIFESRRADLILITAGMILGAVVGYAVSEMLLKKSLQVFRGKALRYAVLSALCIVFTLCCSFDVLSLGSSLPERDDIAAVYVSDMSDKITDSKTIDDVLALNKAILADKDKYSSGPCYNYVHISYVLKNGDKSIREFNICDDENYAEYLGIMSRPEFVLAYFTPSITLTQEHFESASLVSLNSNIEFSFEEAVGFYEAMLADIAEGNLVPPYIQYTGSGDYCADFYITLFENNNYDEIFASISSNCTNCIEWLKAAKGIDLTQVSYG